MIRPASSTRVAAAVLLVACNGAPHGDDATASGTETSTDTDGDTDEGTGTDTDAMESPISVIWDDAGAALVLLRGDDPLLRFPADGFQLGVVAALDESKSYDPFFTQPDQWLTVTAAGPDMGGAAVARRLTFTGGAEADLVVSEDAPGRFSATLTPVAGGPALAYLRLRPAVAADEGFYGLGEQFDRPEHRGTVRAMQLEFDAGVESQNNEAHVPVPFVIGTRGWGLFVESPYAATFDVAAAAADRVDATFGTGPATGDGLRFHLFGADHPLDVTRHYYEVTGLPREPAPWTLGNLVWRDENDDQAQVEADLHAMRDLDLPTSGIWIDRPYASAVNTFDFEPARFPAPQAMIDLAHDLGFRMALWHTPYVDPDDPISQPLAAEADAAGYFPPIIGFVTSKWGPPLDLTNPAAYAWWKAKIELYQGMGIEGYKLDYGEDVTVGPTGFAPKVVLRRRLRRADDARVLLDDLVTGKPRDPARRTAILARGGCYGGQTERPRGSGLAIRQASSPAAKEKADGYTFGRWPPGGGLGSALLALGLPSSLPTPHTSPLAEQGDLRPAVLFTALTPVMRRSA
ncbi:MAG: glycoside hydrolase family 31 protein [Nannocystaceae bacterium]